MIFTQRHRGGGSIDGIDGDRKHRYSVGAISCFRASNEMLSAGLPSNIAQNTMGIFSPAVGLNFGSLGGSGQPSISDNLHSGLGSSDTRGLAAINGTSLHYDIQNYNQRSCELVAANMHAHHIKKEKIVLNLGVRTYLSTEDSAVGRLSKRHRVGSPSSQLLICQANDCKADLSLTKDYYRRHKVCEFHSKAPVVTVGGNSQRFCQQCSRFHCLGEFDNGKRSCRKRLADHNRRRRKIQSDAPTSGGTSTESITVNDVCNDEELHKNFSRLNDPKAWLSMYLENCGSPCFVSLKATNEKLGASCDKLQIQATDLNLCPRDDYRSSHSGISMNSQHMTSAEAQVSLPAMSLLQHDPFPQHKSQQLIMPVVTREYESGNSTYQHHLQGRRHSQSGPNLSYSSRGQQGLQGRGGRRPMSGQSCNKTQPPVHWLKPINASSDNMTELVCRQGTMKMQNLLPTDSKSGITSASASSSISQEHDVEVFSPTNQNLLPMGSNDLSSLEWMPGSMREAQTAHSVFNPFGQSTIMSNLQGIAHHEAGDQIVALIDTSNLADANPDNHGCSQNVLTKNAQMEHQQQKTPEADSGGGNNCRGGSSPVDSPDIKYSDLQLLRPDSYGSSAYDSHLNLF